jgi:hypothetical protein
MPASTAALVGDADNQFPLNTGSGAAASGTAER